MSARTSRAPLPGYGAFLAGWGVTTFGSGLMLPITVIYLREVLHLPLSGVSLYFAVFSLGGLVVNPLAIRIGRVHGPGTSVAAAALLQAVGWGLFAVADSVPLVVVAAALSGAGTGMYYAVQTPVLNRVFGDDALSRVLAGQNRVTAVTMTAGTLLAGQAVLHFGTGGYTACLVVNAVSYLVHGAVLVSLVRKRGEVPVHLPQDASRRVRGAALRDPVFLCLLVFQFCAVIFGLGQFDSVVPAILGNAQLSVTAISIVIACNTGGVIVLQGLALRVVERIGYVAALAAAIVSWTVAAAVLGCALLASGTLSKLALGAAFGVLFAVGECLIAPSVQPLVTRTAPPHSLESYAAATSLAHGLGTFIAPLILLPAIEVAGVGAYFVLQFGGFGLALYALFSFRRRTTRRLEPTSH
ncbi:MFS transporter [Lentzea sp. HUAS12]|uniref:MFS transporter n=1 Tax=Lentzea sp. HUAS12 TaxID=2951806 RepID=UPI0020A06122|nr:MFS transporter [Lentzea sp. HUAS12]USX53394.1 MFS transporter [Lentzea sp. HUAS12]